MKTLRIIIEKKLSVDEVHDLGSRLSQHYNIGSEHEPHIHSYTRNSYDYANSYLWQKHKGSVKSSPLHEENIKHLDKVMNLHKTPEDMTLHSKSIHDPRKLKNDQDVVHHPAYLSTSISSRVVHNLKRNERKDSEGNIHHHILEIHVPKGSPGAYIGHHAENPTHETQREFILPKAQNLKYHTTDTKIDNTTKNHYHVHHMELLND